MCYNKIVDLSEWQEKVDFSILKNEVSGVILRCGYGDDIKAQDDALFSKYYSECVKYNIPVGVYFYTYASNTSHLKSELAHLKRLLKDRKLNLPVFIDFEEPSVITLSSSRLADLMKQFRKVIEELGFVAGAYASLSVWERKLTDPIFDNQARWVAQYYTTCQYKKRVDLWQYTDVASIRGIEGRVDCSISYLHSNELLNKLDIVLNDYKNVVIQTLNNVYGVGSERKNNITKKGYNYDIAQGIINEIYK